MKITALTRVGNNGWEAYGFQIDDLPDGPCEINLRLYTEEGQISWPFNDLHHTGDTVRILCPRFSYFDDFTLTVNGDTRSRETVDEVHTLWADLFEEYRNEKLWYRLYAPKNVEPAPLVLFLHGGGECGTDNWKQMVNTIGAAKIAETYPNAYVMAPQTPVDPRKQSEEKDGPRGYATARLYGWTKEYLALVCGEIRRLVNDGRVDPKRIYVTGSGRGGGGCFLVMEIAQDLFAAAAPVSPRITPEVTQAMLKAANKPVWVSIPYIDEQPERNKYIVDAILAMKDIGGRKIHLTIYSAEELAAYGIGIDKTLTLEERIKQNHRAWILTYNNEAGILDWLFRQHQ